MDNEYATLISKASGNSYHLSVLGTDRGQSYCCRTRDDVLTELPPRTTEIVRITPTDEQKRLSVSIRSGLQVIAKIRSNSTKFIGNGPILGLDWGGDSR